MSTINISNVVNVTLTSTPIGLGSPNINTIALFIKEVKPSSWSVTQEYGIYYNANNVIQDFGTTSEASKQAIGIFNQNINILSTSGYLAIIPLTSSQSMEKGKPKGSNFLVTWEKVKDAIVRIQSKVYFTGILIDQLLDDATLSTLSDYVQTLDKILFYGSANVGDISGIFTTLQSKKNTKTRCLLYTGDGTNSADMQLKARLMACSYASRGLSVNFDGMNTTPSMQLKDLVGIEPDNGMTETIVNQCKVAGVDIYVGFGGTTGLLTSGANKFFDEIYNEIWFKGALQRAGFNYLKQTNTKIPQTEDGMIGLKNAYGNVCKQGVENGYLHSGSWTSPDTFGDPERFRKNIEQAGYYIWSTPITKQSQEDRLARKAPFIEIAVKTAGAIHSSNVIVNINQ